MERKDLSFSVEYERGILSTILNKIENFNMNIISGIQGVPTSNVANIELEVESDNMNVSVRDFLDELKKIKGVCNVNLM